MKEDQLTPWFPAEVKPVHVGWYHTKDWSSGEPEIRESKCNWYWDGRAWRFSDVPDSTVCSFQCRPWRGLRSKP